MNGFIKAHSHSLMSGVVFVLLVGLNVAHLSSPSVDGIAALLMAGFHLDGITGKYLAANSARAETISHLAGAIMAGLQAWNEGRPAPTPETDGGPVTKRDIKVAPPITPEPPGAA